MRPMIFSTAAKCIKSSHNNSFLRQRHIQLLCNGYLSTNYSFPRFISTEPNEADSNKSTSVSKIRENPYAHLTLGEKVKQAGKDAKDMTVIIFGVGITGVLFYYIYQEFFSKKSPMNVYSEALKLCRKDIQVSSVLGEPIKGYGETTSRGRRRNVKHTEYLKDDRKCMRMQFYIEGPHKKGVVHLDVQENDQRKYEYRYIFVNIDSFPKQTIVLQDNR